MSIILERKELPDTSDKLEAITNTLLLLTNSLQGLSKDEDLKSYDSTLGIVYNACTMLLYLRSMPIPGEKERQEAYDNALKESLIKVYEAGVEDGKKGFYAGKQE